MELWDRVGVRLSGDVRAVSWAEAWGVSGPRATPSENRLAERGARERAAGCGVKEGGSRARGERGWESWAGRVGVGPRKKSGPGWVRGKGGSRVGLLWAEGWVWVEFWVFFSNHFPISISNSNSNQMNSNLNLNSL